MNASFVRNIQLLIIEICSMHNKTYFAIISVFMPDIGPVLAITEFCHMKKL